MVKTNLVLCDMCKDKVGRTRCNLCNKDLCGDCVRRIGIIIRKRVNSGYFREIPIVFCKECYQKLLKVDIGDTRFFDNNFMNKLRKEVVDYTKKNLILENLKEK